MSDSKFRGKLNLFEQAAWISFILIVQNILGSHKTENDTDLINSTTKNGMTSDSYLDSPPPHKPYLREISIERKKDSTKIFADEN